MSDKAGVTPTQAGQQSKLNSVEGRVLGSSNTLSKIASHPSPSSKAPQKPKDLMINAGLSWAVARTAVDRSIVEQEVFCDIGPAAWDKG